MKGRVVHVFVVVQGWKSYLKCAPQVPQVKPQVLRGLFPFAGWVGRMGHREFLSVSIASFAHASEWKNAVKGRVVQVFVVVQGWKSYLTYFKLASDGMSISHLSSFSSSSPPPFFKKIRQKDIIVNACKIVNLGGATRATLHNQLPPETNCEQLLLPRVHLMASILFNLILTVLHI